MPHCGVMTLLWRHTGRTGVSNHQSHDCLLKCSFRRRSKKTSKLHATGLCVGIHRWPVNSPHKWPVTRKMFPFDDVIMERCLSLDIGLLPAQRQPLPEPRITSRRLTLVVHFDEIWIKSFWVSFKVLHLIFYQQNLGHFVKICSVFDVLRYYICNTAWYPGKIVYLYMYQTIPDILFNMPCRGNMTFRAVSRQLWCFPKLYMYH